MPNNVSASPIYESYIMQHPDGTVMCRCNFKKAQWYMDRNLAVWVDDETFRLIFEPQGHGKSDNVYYTQKLENKCVVCGREDHLNKHHVFPYVFRSKLPIQYKESNHHDILPICVDCHEEYEDHANQYKIDLANKYSSSGMHIVLNEDQKKDKKIRSARKVLKQFTNGEISGIPSDRIEILSQLANESLSQENPPSCSNWSNEIIENFMEEDKLHEFIKSWREHFIEYAKPQYLPELWSVDHKLEVLEKH